MKISKKILFILTILMLICVMASFLKTSYAYDYTTDIKNINKETGSDSNSKGKVTDVVGAILKTARVIATGVALIMIVVLAMKYMMAAPGEKAEIKKHAVVYIVGAIVLFASSGLLGIIQSFATGNIKLNSAG